MTEDGTLWLDYPGVGGPSPEIVVKTEPEAPAFYYHHSLWIEGGPGWSWVAASGVKGLSSVTIEGLETAPYTVRLYFAEPEEMQPGRRVFDVSLQGDPVLQGLDIIKEAGGRMRSLIKEFESIQVAGTLKLGLSSHAGHPLLCGIELVAEGLEPDPAMSSER